MADRRPHVRFLGDEVLAKEFLRYGKSELYRTKSLASLMGVPTYARRSPILSNRVNQDESYVLTTVAGGIEYIDIFAVTAGVTLEAVPEEDEVERRFVLYSGFAYKNWMPFSDTESSERDLQHPTIQDFQPTVDTYQRITGDFPLGNVYQPNERLNIEPAYSASSADSGAWGPPALEDAPAGSIAAQTQVIRPCMFSGLLQQAAAIALGIGDLRLPRTGGLASLLQGNSNSSAEYIERCKAYGLQCEYRQAHTITHGIVQAAPGICWLVECSQARGLIARRLPVLDKNLFILNGEEGLIIDQLGGVPTGEAFNVDIDQGIAEGWIIHVDAGVFAEYYDTSSYGAEGYSWCFNPDGSEARTTTRSMTDSGLHQSVYWKLQINATAETISASVSKIREDICVEGRAVNFYSNWSNPFYWDDPTDPVTGGLTNIRPEWGGDALRAGNTTTSGQLNVGFSPFTQHTASHVFYPNRPTNTIYKDHWDEIPDEMEAVIWVGWINGQWSEIYYRSSKIVEKYVDFCPAAIEDIADFYTRFADPQVLPSRGSHADGGYVPVGVEPFNPDSEWVQIPRGQSTELQQPLPGWKTSRNYQQTIIFDVKDIRANQMAHREDSGIWRFYYNIALEAAIKYRTLKRGPKGRLYYLIPAFNRNAYYCVDRTDQNEYTNNVTHYTTLVVCSARSFRLVVEGTDELVDTTLTTFVNPSDFDPLVWSGPNLGTQTLHRDYSSVVKGTLEGYRMPNPLNIDIHGIPIHLTTSCASPPSAPPTVYYIQHDRFTQPLLSGGSNYPGTEFMLPYGDFYYQLDDGWAPFSLCQVLGPTAPGGVSTALHPYWSASSTTAYPATEIPAFYEAEIWLVADGLPDGPVLELGTIFTEDVEAAENWEMEWWCQVAVLGAEAAIYTDFSALPAPDPALTMKDFAYTSSGIHPPLPATGDTYQYTRLTFVGINGP